MVSLALNTNRKKNERLSCGRKIACLTRKKHKNTHCENQKRFNSSTFLFLCCLLLIYEAILTIPLAVLSGKIKLP
jgi:hypothetical protein